MIVYPAVPCAFAHEAATGRLRIAPRRILAGAEPGFAKPHARDGVAFSWKGQSPSANASQVCDEILRHAVSV
jgi:hypothetical protein